MDNRLPGSLVPELNEDYGINETQSSDRQGQEIYN